ncbi:MAG: HAD family hydrolase [Lachnospiraceae bacterium]|nr:HAD family hydrolase [Lachnospiraceae bacterium]
MIEKNIDGLILDVDGTLWDSTPIVARAWERAARESGLPDYRVTPDMLKGLFGKTMAVIAEQMFPELPLEQRTWIMELCCEYEHDDLEADACDICYPGVISGIKELSKKIPVFIVSNCQSGYIELFLEKTGLGPYVADIECFGNTRKSKGENIALVAKRNHLKAPVYVGDTQGDRDAAFSAGVPFIFASYGFGTVDRSDAKIAGFSDLTLFVEGGSGR